MVSLPIFGRICSVEIDDCRLLPSLLTSNGLTPFRFPFPLTGDNCQRDPRQSILHHDVDIL